MYSGNLSAAVAVALHGLERRMTHPTARTPATGTLSRDTVTPEGPTVFAAGSGAGLPSVAGDPSGPSFDAAFRRALLNFVEMRAARFHYFVIDRHASASPATGYVGRRPLNDEVQPRTSKCERLAHASILPSSARQPSFHPVHRRLGVTTEASPQTGRPRFGPAEKRMMRMTMISPTQSKSLSPKRASE
jgi:hypothetical protein